jgi:hypothetical protein
MRHTFLKISVLALGLSAIIFTGCATHQGAQGAAVGTVLGGASGALIDRSNPWRGAVIGGGVGAVVGGALGEASAYQAPRSRSYYPDRYDSRYRYYR